MKTHKPKPGAKIELTIDPAVLQELIKGQRELNQFADEMIRTDPVINAMFPELEQERQVAKAKFGSLPGEGVTLVYHPHAQGQRARLPGAVLGSQ